MAKRSERLLLVVNLAERELEKSASILAKASQQVTFEQGRLEELQSYFNEYQLLAKTQSKAGISVVRLMNFNHFMSNLRAAIDQQTKTITYLEKQQQKAREVWIKSKSKLKNLQKLQASAVTNELYLEEKNLQKTFDDSFVTAKQL